MKKINITCLFVLTVFFAASQTIKRNLLQSFSPQTVSQSLLPQNKWKPFPQTPAEWIQQYPDSVLRKIIAKGENALSKEFRSLPAATELEYVRTGDRERFQRLSFSKRNQLFDLVLAESIEGKGRFCDQIMNGIWSICEETFWGIPTHLGAQKAGAGLPDAEDPIVDLFAAETASVLAWTDYFSGNAMDKISKLIRKRIHYEMRRRIFDPMQSKQFGWMGKDDDSKLNNWAPWIMSNYLTAALLTEQDESKRANEVMLAMKIIDRYINGLGEDGGCDEGPGYWFAAGAAVFDGLNLLKDATNGKISIYEHPFIQKMASYIYKTHIAGEYFINVADAPPTMKPDGLELFRFGKEINDKTMMEFGSWAYHYFLENKIETEEQFFRSRVLYNLSAQKDCASYSAAFKDVKDVWFADIQLMASRSSNGLFIATHAGNNGESHNHNDVGDFMVYADGYPVIIDVGAGTYTARTFSASRYKLWFNTSPYHNLPTVGKFQQGVGKIFAAEKVAYKSVETLSQLSMNIAPAYPKQSGIQSWIRTVQLNKKEGIATIADKFSITNVADTITQSFMTTCAADLSKEGKIFFSLPDGNTNVILEYDATQWKAMKEKIVLSTPEDERFKQSWGGKDIWRILLVNRKHDAVAENVYRIHK